MKYAVRRAQEKSQVAASLTYTTVLSLVPLLAVVLALFTAFPLFADSSRRARKLSGQQPDAGRGVRKTSWGT